MGYIKAIPKYWKLHSFEIVLYVKHHEVYPNGLITNSNDRYIGNIYNVYKYMIFPYETVALGTIDMKAYKPK